jgi:subtilisin family serine protease
MNKNLLKSSQIINLLTFKTQISKIFIILISVVTIILISFFTMNSNNLSLVDAANTTTISNTKTKIDKATQDFINGKATLDYNDNTYTLLTTSQFKSENLKNEITIKIKNANPKVEKLTDDIYIITIDIKANKKVKPQNVVSELSKNVLKVLENNLDITSVGFDFITKNSSVDTDVFLSKPLNKVTDRIGAYGSLGLLKAWETNQGSPDTVINIIDTGFDLSHPQLAGQFITGYNFAWGDGDLLGDDANQTRSHGTSIAGIIAGKHDANTFNGICQYCKLYASTTGVNGGISTSAAIAAFSNAINQKHKIIALAYGPDQINIPNTIETNLAQKAYNQGIIVINAHGNENIGDIPSFGGSSKPIIVSALNFDLKKSSYSSFGPRADISAIGGDLVNLPESGNYIYCGNNTYSTFKTANKGGKFNCFSGTSQASALVVGIMGLIVSKYPTINPDDAKMLLQKGATSISSQNPGYEGQLGAGLVNAYNSLNFPFTPTPIKPIVNVTLPYDPGKDWNFEYQADLNKDGFQDLVWKHKINGTLVIWYLNGYGNFVSGTKTAISSRDAQIAGVALSDTKWSISAIGDIDSDGNQDFIFSHPSGNRVIWYLNESKKIINGALLPNPSTDWDILAAVDTNNDKKDDLVFRHKTEGVIVVWRMDSEKIIEGGVVSTFPDYNVNIYGAYQKESQKGTDGYTLKWFYTAGPAAGQMVEWNMKGYKQV